MCVLQGFQCIWEKCRHFLLGFHVVLTAFVAHTVCIGQLLPCLETQKNVVRISIFFVGVMNIVSGYQVNSSLLVHAQKLLVYILLFRNSMILKLQEKIAFAENFLIAEGRLLSVRVHSSVKEPGYFTGQAGAQRDEAFVIFPEKLQVYSWFIVKAFFKAFGYNFHKVLVALIVLGKKYQMVVTVVATADLAVEAGTRGYIDFAAKDRIDSGCFRCPVKIDDAVHDPMVCDGRAVHPKLLYTGNIFFYFIGTVQQGVFGVDVEVGKSHCVSPSSQIFYLVCWEGEKFFRRDAFGQCVLLTRRRNAPAN